jgi:hypothetical protein
VEIMTNKTKMGLQFFFTEKNGKFEIRRAHINQLMKAFSSETEVNTIVSFRVSKIVESLVETHQVEVFRAFKDLNLEELLLRHFYDDSVSLSIFFNVFIDIKGLSNDVSITFESPKKSRSPSFDNTFWAELAENEPIQDTMVIDPFMLSVKECWDSPQRRKSKDQGLTGANDSDILKDFVKKKTNNSLNVSNNMDYEVIARKYFGSVWEFRLATIRKLIDMISSSRDEAVVVNGLGLLLKMLQRSNELLSCTQLLVNIFYKENNLPKIFAGVKISGSDTIIAQMVDFLIALLEHHNDIFSGKVCEDKGVKLGAKFFGIYIDIIEEMKDFLPEVRSQGLEEGGVGQRL